MKILLIYPYPLFDRSKAHEEDISAMPIGMYYVGAVLKKNNYTVKILNWVNIHKTPDKIVSVLEKERPDIIGFSILNANRWGGIEIARIAKKINPKTRIVFGGVAATFLWKHFLRHFPEIDFVVLGEGERAFLKLVQRIQKADFNNLKAIEGIAFRKGNAILKTTSPPLVKNLDALPIPAQYFTYQHVISSRGCPGNCTFCGSPRFWSHRVRFRSAENFVQELDMLYSKGVRFFYFSDDTFTQKKQRVIEICKKILKKGLDISWFAIARADHVNEEMLYWMRKAGCIQISYGVESGSKKIREMLGKPIKKQQIKRAFHLTHRYGILARAYFIYGSPEETWDTVQETVELIKEIKPFICISYILEIYPGTRLYKDYQKREKVTDDIWLKRIEGICYFQTDPSMTQERIMAFGQKIRSAVYENIHLFVDSLNLIDDREFFPMHGDFCSRLAMTLSHGDYGKIDTIRDKKKAAERLFNKALEYAPDHRAYLGLGLLKQDHGDFQSAVEVLTKGVAHFPHSEELHLCLGINLMNLGRFQEALSCLVRFEVVPQARRYIAECHRALTAE
jgi:radical SAM superfamily enzyme YgiQ (UPF0313 family)